MGDEEQYMNPDRPNPDHDGRAAASSHGLPRLQDASHWKSTHIDDFQGEYGPSSPQAADPHTRRAELSPVPGGETLQDEPEKSVLDLINKKDDKKAPGSHIQLLVKRPWTHHVGMRPRQGSRQGRMAQRGCHKGEVAGTSQGTEGKIPCLLLLEKCSRATEDFSQHQSTIVAPLKLLMARRTVRVMRRWVGTVRDYLGQLLPVSRSLSKKCSLLLLTEDHQIMASQTHSSSIRKYDHMKGFRGSTIQTQDTKSDAASLLTQYRR